MDRRGFVGGLAVLGVGGGWAAWEMLRYDGSPGSSGSGLAGAPGGGSPGAGSAIPSPAGQGNGAMGPGTLPDRWGVQLYTVRDRMAEDVRGTLEAVAKLVTAASASNTRTSWSGRRLGSTLIGWSECGIEPLAMSPKM